MNYDQLLTAVLTNFALDVIYARGDLGILSLVEDIPLDDRRAGLPSWVAGWTVPCSPAFPEVFIGKKSK